MIMTAQDRSITQAQSHSHQSLGMSRDQLQAGQVAQLQLEELATRFKKKPENSNVRAQIPASGVGRNRDKHSNSGLSGNKRQDTMTAKASITNHVTGTDMLDMLVNLGTGVPSSPRRDQHALLSSTEPPGVQWGTGHGVKKQGNDWHIQRLGRSLRLPRHQLNRQARLPGSHTVPSAIFASITSCASRPNELSASRRAFASGPPSSPSSALRLFSMLMAYVPARLQLTRTGSKVSILRQSLV